MKNLDPVPRQPKRIERRRVAGSHRRLDFLAVMRKAPGSRSSGRTGASPRSAPHRAIRHVVDDGAGRALDISGYLAFDGEKPANRSAKSALLLSNRTGMVAFGGGSGLEACPLLNGAATNRRQPFSLSPT